MVTLSKPSGGDTDWNQEINDNWTALEGLFPFVCQGRLTLTSGTPVTTSNVTAATTVYFTPFRGNRVALYDGSNWSIYSFTERSLSLSGLIANTTHDVFIYDNSGTLTLESLVWKKVTATNNPTAGANKVINVPDTSGVAVGDLVTVRDSTNNEVTKVTVVVANTSITVDNLVNGYTTPDVYYNSRATALTLQDGVYVKSGATTRRYLGTIRITGTAGQTEDSTSKRFVWNYYNRLERHLNVIELTNSWTYSTATWRSANNSTANRVALVIGVSEDLVQAKVHCTMFQNGGGGHSAVGVGVDKTNGNDATFFGSKTNASGSGRDAPAEAHYRGYPGVGYHYLQWVEKFVTSFTVTWYGDNGQTDFRRGLEAWVTG